jgi:hypothetical protein
MNRNKVERTVFAIDMGDKLRNLAFKFRGISQSRRCNLDKDRLEKSSLSLHWGPIQIPTFPIHSG